ncbi:MAG: HPr-rel-A system PqqD family peptide chaperone [Sphingomonadaceae bacterium]|nr:HPr-rel-A system PqqD family peptide chaperone [Sphingomonadaceae bacterium]
MTGSQPLKYKAEPADRLLVEPLDAITLIYQRRSGITHMVAEPVPEILTAMGSDVLDANAVAIRLASQFELNDAEAIHIVAARLEEMAALGLVERVHA